MNEIKDRLRNYKRVKALKNEYELKIRELNNNLGASGVSYEDKGGQTYKISRATEDKAIKIAEKEELLKRLIDENQIEIERIENALSALKEEERIAIELLYIEKYSLGTICYKMQRSERTIKRHLSKGLNTIKNIIK